MRGWLLDTNILSEVKRPKPDKRVLDWFYSLSAERTFISVLALAELDRGVEALQLGDTRRAALARYRRRVEEQFTGRVLPLSDEIVRMWGSAAGRMQRDGVTAPPVDALLAATALRHRLHIATRNTRDFIHLGVIPFNPWTDDPADFPLRS